MHKVIVLGAGQIGMPTACLLAKWGEYEVHLVDAGPITVPKGFEDIEIHPSTDVELFLDTMITNIGEVEAVLSCLPFALNKGVADLALKHDIHYFDLTEDVETTKYVQSISQESNKVFMPQCGLAPGFVSLAAASIMSQFEKVDTVKMRVGALPTNPNNKLKYNLTWSTNGLINECGNPCKVVVDGEQVMVPPLEGLETITLDGVEYECFTTSGGIGSLADSVGDQVKHMNYKTMRYPGHCELFKFLMFDMKLNDNRDVFTEMLETAIPTTNDDVVIIYVSVEGTIDGKFTERHRVFKNYGMKGYRADFPMELTAIQLTTAAGLCAVVDIVLNGDYEFEGFTEVEQISLDTFLKNRFGKLYEA